jgi:hypothetical protein
MTVHVTDVFRSTISLNEEIVSRKLGSTSKNGDGSPYFGVRRLSNVRDFYAPTESGTLALLYPCSTSEDSDPTRITTIGSHAAEAHVIDVYQGDVVEKANFSKI